MDPEPITSFRAFWQPGKNTYGIDITTQARGSIRLAIESPDEFVALVAILNGPNPVLWGSGNIQCSR